MAVRQYVGARYVPKFYQNSQNPLSSEWEGNKAYEALTIVTYNNSSYTSKIPVPAGIGNPAQNPTYWVVTGNYNAQVEQYRQITVGVQDGLNAEITNRENAEKALKEELDNTINTLDTKLNYFFKTMALLKASDVKAGDVVKTGGYYTLNDNGGAYYLISDTAQGYSEQLDNGLYAVLQNKIVTPEMFGAYGDDTHNDAKAIQDALDNSKTVKLSPSKTYKCNSGITVKASITSTWYSVLDFSEAATTIPFVTIVQDGGWIENIVIYGKAKLTNTIPTEENEVSGIGLQINTNGLYLSRILIAGCKTGVTFGAHAYNIHFNDLKIFNCWTGILADSTKNEDSGENVHFDGGILSANHLAISSIYFVLTFNNVSIDYNRKIGELGNIADDGSHYTNTYFYNCFFENRNSAPFNDDYQITKNGNYWLSLVIDGCAIGLATPKLLKTSSIIEKCIISNNNIVNTSVDPYEAYFCDSVYGTVKAINNSRLSLIVGSQFTPISVNDNLIDTTYNSFVKHVTDGTATKDNNVLTLTNGDQFKNANTYEIIPLQQTCSRALMFAQIKNSIAAHGAPLVIEALDALQNTLSSSVSPKDVGTEYSNISTDITIPEGTRYLKVTLGVPGADNGLICNMKNIRLFID